MRIAPLLLSAGLTLFSATFASAADEVMRVALLSSSPQSALYKWSDNAGRVYYSDKPPVGIARDYEVTAMSPRGGMVQVGTKPISEYLPLPVAPKDIPLTANKPKPDLTANLVWLDSAR